MSEADLVRCPWAGPSLDYVEYHDREWGRPVRGDQALFERLSLEGFQSGLSWITILRRREGFRNAFVGFDPQQLAEWGPDHVDRLVLDEGIIRHRGKIEATLSNARVLAQWHAEEGDGVLDALVWSFAKPGLPRPVRFEDVPAQTPESLALSKTLRARGWRFLGPTTAYAAMQACGVVDDHLRDCFVKAAPDVSP